MELYVGNDNFSLYQGSMLDMLEVLQPNTIDSVVTDPPYELGFMGKSWDNSGIAFQPDTWAKCYEVLKPGGYLLAFGGSRTFHRIACAIEDAGFEIRDTIMWLYGSGFPKSMNIGLAIDKKNGVESEVIGQGRGGVSSRAFQSEDTTTAGEYQIKQAQNEWDGWGTALKPAYEPIIVARKPCEGACIDNVLKYRVGGINIDECRIGDDIILSRGGRNQVVSGDERTGKALGYNAPHDPLNTEHQGRFPSNVILTYDDTDEDEVCGGMPDTENITKSHTSPNSISSIPFNTSQTINVIGYEDSGSASRYFYCAKASKRDRDEGLEQFADQKPATTEYRPFLDQMYEEGYDKCNDFLRLKPKKNIHPTVKPTDLMQYLIRLVTPKGGIVLDPFNGSGSTGKATMYENKDRNAGYRYIGIELTPEYLPIAEARIQYAINNADSAVDSTMSESKRKVVSNQLSLFDLS